MPFLSSASFFRPFSASAAGLGPCRSVLGRLTRYAFAGISLAHCTPTQPLDSYRDGEVNGIEGRAIRPVPDAGPSPSQRPDSAAPSVDAGRPDATIPSPATQVATDAAAPLPSADAAGTRNCTGALEFAADDSCYLAVVEETTWQTGRDTCLQWGGDLVTINSPEEDALLADNGPAFDYWIGYNDQTTEGEYTWVSSLEGLSGADALWAGGQPTDTADENCVARLTPNPVLMLEPRWYDRGCTEAYGSFCERPLQ